MLSRRACTLALLLQAAAPTVGWTWDLLTDAFGRVSDATPPKVGVPLFAEQLWCGSDDGGGITCEFAKAAFRGITRHAPGDSVSLQLNFPVNLLPGPMETGALTEVTESHTDGRPCVRVDFAGTGAAPRRFWEMRRVTQGQYLIVVYGNGDSGPLAPLDADVLCTQLYMDAHGGACAFEAPPLQLDCTGGTMMKLNFRDTHTSCFSSPACPNDWTPLSETDNTGCKDEVLCQGCCVSTTRQLTSWWGWPTCRSGWEETARNSPRWWQSNKVTCTGCTAESRTWSDSDYGSAPTREQNDAKKGGGLSHIVAAAGAALGAVACAAVVAVRRRNRRQQPVVPETEEAEAEEGNCNYAKVEGSVGTKGRVIDV